MNRLNTDMKNEIINWLNPIYLAFSLIYVSKEFNKLSIRKLTILEYLPCKYKYTVDKLSLLTTDISMDRFLGFGVTVTEIFKYMPYYSSMYNNIDLLKYLNEVAKYDYPMESNILEESFTSIDTLFIAASGSFECMKYILEEIEKDSIGKSHDILSQSTIDYNNRYYTEDVCKDSYQTIYSCAITNGSLECLKYLLENGYSCIGNLLYTEEFHPFDKSVLECLKYACTNGCQMNRYTYIYAAGTGSLECLIYLRENEALYRIGENQIFISCKWDESICSNAAQSGSLECLRYLREGVDQFGNFDIHNFENQIFTPCPWDEDTCSSAAESGSLECLKYAHENGCPWDKETCNSAARSGSLECLKYAHENGCPWNKRTYMDAILSKSLECLKYAHENVDKFGIRDPCPWDEYICSFAVSCNSLECLKYLRENVDKFGIRETRSFENQRFSPCPWDENTCIAAAEFNSLECLKYAHEYVNEFGIRDPCPWSEDTCIAAAKFNALECLKYAHENGCPWSVDTCRAAVKYNSVECVKYIVEYIDEFEFSNLRIKHRLMEISGEY